MKPECPKCKTEVTLDSSGRAVCSECGQRFKLADGLKSSADDVGIYTTQTVQIQKLQQLNRQPAETMLSDDTSDTPQAAGRLAEILSALRTKQAEHENDDSPGAAAGNVTRCDSEHYKLGDVVAQGGMGAIIAARDLNIRRHVAMKVMLNPTTASENNVLRFIEEAQITGQLEHPGVVPVHQLGVDSDGNVFYTMKFVHGLNLGEILNGLADGDPEIIRRFPLTRLLNIFLKICETMAFAHSRRVIHRDLKPDNIMVGEYGEVLVLDWGLGKVLDELPGDGPDLLPPEISAHFDSNASAAVGQHETNPVEQDSRVESVRSGSVNDTAKTMAGAVMGTPLFMPPEQARGETDRLDDRADIYSLGAILYNILTLRPPVKGDSALDVLAKVVSGQITPPDRHPDLKSPNALPHTPDGKVSSSLSAVVMKALSVDPAKRYRSVTELQSEIEAWQSGFATNAEDAGRWRQFLFLLQRNKGAAAGLTAVILALSVGMGVALVQRNNARDANDRATENYKKLISEESRLARVSHSAAPEFVEKAQTLLLNDQRDEALIAIDTAIGLFPELGDAWYQKGRLHVDAYQFDDAMAAFDKAQIYSATAESRRQVSALRELALKARSFPQEDGDKLLPERLLSLATSLEESGDSVLAGRIYSRMGDLRKGLQVKVLAAIRELERSNPGLQFHRADGFDTEFGHFYWHHVTKDDGLELGLPGTNDSRKLVNIDPLAHLPIRRLRLGNTGVGNLTALRHMPLTSLDISDTSILSLQDLEGLPLEVLDAGNNRITDLSPLSSLPLKSLTLAGLKIDSIAALSGLQLEYLDLRSCPAIQDLSVIEGMPLKYLDLHATGVTSLASLRGMQLKEFSAPAGATDLNVLRGMPLTSLELSHTQTTDISPLEGMRLDSLKLTSGTLEDFTPLRRIQCRMLTIECTKFTDLNLIAHMQLEELAIHGKTIIDLSPLKSMRLKKLTLADCQTGDLSVVADMPLESLSVSNLPLTDLSPLSELPLTELSLVDCPVANIKPLSGLPLRTLYLVRCPNLNDLRPIATLENLGKLGIPEHCRDIAFLREMPSIYYLNTTNQHKAVAQFWEEFDALEE